CQAQLAVRTATNDVGVGIVLSVILPEADRANIEVAAAAKRDVLAARTGVLNTRSSRTQSRMAVKPVYVPLKPAHPTFQFLRAWLTLLRHMLTIADNLRPDRTVLL